MFNFSNKYILPDSLPGGGVGGKVGGGEEHTTRADKHLNTSTVPKYIKKYFFHMG